MYPSEVESSRTHFEVLGLGLEGQVFGLEPSSPRKRTALFFELLKFCGALEKCSENVFFGDRLKNFCKDLFFF